MPIDSGNLALKGLDELFTTEEKRQEEQREQVQQIPIDELHPFTNHPFKVVDDEAMTRTVESIAQFGVLAPLIARPYPDGDGYEIISGHRRQFAAKMAGLETLPVIVRDMDDDAATILMVDSNLQREHISPSERAFAYKMKMDAMKRTAGRPPKENPRQVVGNFETADLIGKESGESGRQVQRFMTALVGPSGSGKSTIANLLARLWDVKSGSIIIRGMDIRNVPLAELIEQISMVFQRVYLFQDTIYNNISIGKPDATEEEVYTAAKKARCYDFIMALPDGFQTVVGEGGATLSGGEKQRISIARCILKDAPIIILDEATASVDTDNESYIQEAISELVKGKTLLVIAHRLNTIQNADQILVIDNGQIAQQGTHEELLKQPGIYQEFVNIRKNAAGWSLA